MSKRTLFKKNYKIIGLKTLRLCAALLLTTILTNFKFHSVESFFFDMRVKYKPTSMVSDIVKTITIDQETLEALGQEPDAVQHTDLFKKLQAAKPLAVVYEADIENVVGSYEELENMTKSTSEIPFYVAANTLAAKGLEHTLTLPPPMETIKVVQGPRTSDTHSFAKDGVTRRLIYSYQDKKTLHGVLADKVNQHKSHDDYNGMFYFIETQQALIDYKPKGSYPGTSFSKLLSGETGFEKFRGKIVIIGHDSGTHTKDYVRTPFSKTVNAMSSLELHANMMDTLILDSAPIQPPKWITFFITFFISYIVIIGVLMLTPVQGLNSLLIACFSFMVISYVLASFANVYLTMAHPLIAAFLCYYFAVPYRLIRENQKSWEYYQKNKLLTQVEELKSNFLRMMSHDLKTPLARIAGMTDIIKRDSNALSVGQTDAIDTIKQSSQELTEFIGSVLSLGRIESKEIKLQLQSRDVNVLLDEVVKKAEYLAQKKNIEIIKEFEPLFSIQVDTELIRQVFTNLIENAIKYSPENSKVLVSTEDRDGKVIVQVADQGIGISQSEQENIFVKFYRSREVSNTNIKGSGLGLYLAKYFVNLHEGEITIESETNKGSTFQVELPTSLHTVSN